MPTQLPGGGWDISDEEAAEVVMSNAIPPIAELPPIVTSQMSARERAATAIMQGAVRYGGTSISRQAADKIVDDVLGCADTDTFVEALMPDEVYDGMVGGMDSLREHMRNSLAIQVLKDGMMMTALPHEVVDRPAGGGWQFMRRIRLIVPVRKAPAPPS